jgi:hypothetical protein
MNLQSPDSKQDFEPEENMETRKLKEVKVFS